MADMDTLTGILVGILIYVVFIAAALGFSALLQWKDPDASR